MKTQSAWILFTVLFSGVAAGQLFFPDGSEQGTAGITLDRVQILNSDGTDSENGTALLNALSAQASSQTVDVILLEPGTYDLGASSLNLVDFVDLRGFGSNKTSIQGNAAVLVNGANFVGLTNLQLNPFGNGKTALKIDGDRMTLVDVRIQPGATSGTNRGIQVLNGGEAELRAVEISLFTQATGGSYTGLEVTGEQGTNGSSADLGAGCDIVLSDDNGNMALRGVSVGDGTATMAEDGVEVEISAGAIVEVEGGSVSSDGLKIASDGDVFALNACVGAEGGPGDGVDNAGVFNAVSTFIFGDVTGAGTSVFSQCTTETINGATPIVDTNTAVTP